MQSVVKSLRMSCAALVFLSCGAAVHGATSESFSRYQIILDRQPFGTVVVADTSRSVRTAPAESFVKHLKMVAMTESPAGIRVGLIDLSKKPNKNYFLYVGEVEDGLEVVDADYEAEGALLKKGAEEEWLYMGGGSGVPASASTVGPGKIAGRSSYAERRRKRMETLADRRKRELDAAPRMTTEELKEHLQEYQMEVIRKGLPPLPIQLTPEMDDKLVEEGLLPPIAE